MKENSVDRIELVKIDVEGYESKVLAGMMDLLRARLVDNLIVEFCPPLWPMLGESIADCFAQLQSFGYEFVDSQSLLTMHHRRICPRGLQTSGFAPLKAILNRQLLSQRLEL